MKRMTIAEMQNENGGAKYKCYCATCGQTKIVSGWLFLLGFKFNHNGHHYTCAKI